MKRYPIAHTPRSPGQEPHGLVHHLLDVGELAEGFTAVFGAAPWGAAAGRWHDLGKWGPDMQDYLWDSLEAREQGHSIKKRRIEHSIAGAQHAVQEWGRPGELLAFAIAGHHAGLTDYPSQTTQTAVGESSLEFRLGNTERLETALAGLPPDEILHLAAPSLPGNVADLPLFIRMNFSALVDADRLDTERYCDPEISAVRAKAATYETIPMLNARLQAYMSAFVAGLGAAAARPINRLRAGLLRDCLLTSVSSAGLFSLTAPTGLGKTLAGLAFALNHAKINGMHRVIYVAPYISIIEQTAAVYRKAIGSDNVLEHHSVFDPASLKREVADAEDVDPGENLDAASVEWKLTVENWDAPIIVTTAVQFFESLFSSHPSQCRKLHRIANSVVFLDEAQMIPSEFLYPILRTLSELMRAYGVTVILSTATQPALDPRRFSQSLNFIGLTGPVKTINAAADRTESNQRTEIVSDLHALHQATRRFKITLPDFDSPPPTWDELAKEISAQGSSLTIVNTRNCARVLHDLMPVGTIHLSALMCPAHRLEIIEDIKRRLAAHEIVRVVSTQLVEAGVDLDFPIVYRALAGLDSLAQAAGRCNREGILAEGRLVIFEAPDEVLPPALRAPQNITRKILRNVADDPFSPEMFGKFFRQLFWIRGDAQLDKENICDLLPQAALHRTCFRTASDRFRIIDDYREDVIVPWGELGQQIVDQLALGPVELGIEEWRDLLRRAQRYSVGINLGNYGAIVAQGGISVVGKISLLNILFYDVVIGVTVSPRAASLII